MLDTNHSLCFELSPLGSPPMGEGEEKPDLDLDLDLDKQVYHSLKEGGLQHCTCLVKTQGEHPE